ncbi:phosphopyruvate hydratase [Nitrosophilus labii]|uniref:phosphopyruvate hydratase n=1 Tax=Nitrosophilus labii TaxID=2706014 RepID=UPI0018D96595|nr:phosphopyruvate hydratase [Nitrosophilus labii]
MREIIDDLIGLGAGKKYLVLYAVKVLAALVLIIAIGVYIGNLLFGKDSVEVLIEIQNKERALKREVQRLKEENARLQKEYFELKQLEPE